MRKDNVAFIRSPEEGGPVITADDVYLFNEGNHFRLYDKLGAHPFVAADGTPSTSFALWAPDAEYVSVVGDFNDWDRGRLPLRPVGSSGIWHGVARGVRHGALYKYHVASRYHGYRVDKADPFAFCAELAPKTASAVWDLSYGWNDSTWMQERRAKNALSAPMSTYEVHLGSWMRVPEDGERWLSYRELAPKLADYVSRLGFTHVELMPVMEHPFYGSWGYEVTGYFAATRRYGEPQDLMYLIDYLHQRGIGVLLDWVPAHFPSDEYALGYFDGTHLYEHADRRKGFHPDWQSLIFNFGRREVQSFLISSALFWLDKYHADGLRVDGVASMLYLDYSRKEGEWIPNVHGGRENLEAIDFIQRLNAAVYAHFPDVQTIAEESTSWPGVSRPTYSCGLGFGLKWDMGWMHDTLHYLHREPVHRKFHHNEITFRAIYAFTENFVLPLSHDEVVHGKGSLLDQMPGDTWQKFANLRLLYAYMYATPGKKLLFMGDEFGQWREWDHESSLDWHLLDQPLHQGVQRLVTELNGLYQREPSLHRHDTDSAGFQWIDGGDAEQSVTSFLRSGDPHDAPVVCVMNFTPVPREDYRVGVDVGGPWVELFNSDAHEFGGSGVGNLSRVHSVEAPWHGRAHSLNLVLPPLGALFLKPEPR